VTERIELAGGNVLPAGRYELEAFQVPNLPAVVAIDTPCYVLSVQPFAIRSPIEHIRGAGRDGKAGLNRPVGLVVVIATPLEGE
jgi:hypothetical protein